MNAARLEELAVKCERLDVPIDERIDSHDLRDLARCARAVVLLRRVAVRGSMLLSRLSEQNPRPPQSIAVKLARKQLQAALEAVEAAEVKP